jgi:hypothetical protein
MKFQESNNQYQLYIEITKEIKDFLHMYQSLMKINFSPIKVYEKTPCINLDNLLSMVIKLIHNIFFFLPKIFYFLV